MILQAYEFMGEHFKKCKVIQNSVETQTDFPEKTVQISPKPVQIPQNTVQVINTGFQTAMPVQLAQFQPTQIQIPTGAQILPFQIAHSVPQNVQTIQSIKETAKVPISPATNRQPGYLIYMYLNYI